MDDDLRELNEENPDSEVESFERNRSQRKEGGEERDWIEREGEIIPKLWGAGSCYIFRQPSQGST